jgi:hypothetical protein
MRTLTLYEFVFDIKGLHDVLGKNESLVIDEVDFYFQDQYRGKTMVDAADEIDAERKARQHISAALSKIIFAYHTEAFIQEEGYYYRDVMNEPDLHTCSTLGLRWNFEDRNAKITLPKMLHILPQKKDTQDLALAYYQLTHYFNPLRLEALFSCLTVLVRDISGSGYVDTDQLKNTVKDVLQKDSNFEINKFEQDWSDCYKNERCSIAHGKISKLINLENEREYNSIVGKVHSWTRKVFHYFIDTNQQP